MYCPFCRAIDTKVIDSRLVSDGVRRRRECSSCDERFTTYEVAELVLPKKIIKNDGSRVPFDENKLRTGILKSLEKRPVSLEKIETAIHHILHQLRISGEREVTSQLVGEMVMRELRLLDQVAYVRFASVYRSFQDVQAFSDEVLRLQQQQITEDNY